MSGPYTRSFYAQNRVTSGQSADAAVPMLTKLLSPASVVDVGCGVGGWLAAFREAGIDDTLGIDGAHVSRDLLRIPETCFMCHDLATPLGIERRFDLALSLEVAEHLAPDWGQGFVDMLCALSDTVVFSAAIPGQTGQGHVNEQWPEYWVERFDRAGYATIDVLRPLLWAHPGVSTWYAQNMFLFIKHERLTEDPALAALAAGAPGPPFARVHPQAWVEAIDPRRMDFRDALVALPCSLIRGIRARTAALAARCTRHRSGHRQDTA